MFLLLHWRLMQIGMRPHLKGSEENISETTTVFLPQDILASILVRLPGSDLRRLRRVCRQWRDIISDPTFIHAHMVQKPRLPPTHTIVFFAGSAYGGHEDPGNGRGFLFDEHWRLTAELAVGRWDELVGACNGLLCFLESGQGSIKIVEPFTGESLAVPLPPEASGLRWNVNSAAYCFGFDAVSRRYKIVHHGYLEDSSPPREGESVDDEELHVYTVGADGKGWTRLHLGREVYGEAYGDPSYADGAVYWPTGGHGKRGRDKKLVRFDLATEKVTLEAAVRLQLDAPGQETAEFCRMVDLTPCMMTYGLHCEWDAWFPEDEEGGASCFPGGCVLLSDSYDYGLYLRSMERSLKLGPRKLLFEASEDQPPVYDYNGRASFVPVCPHQQLPIAGGQPVPSEDYCVSMFGYTPTVSAAPLALYFGTPSP
uniref:Uncharacterized protein n=1 Tax=Avena sativa TaxID=4498 RepID=A0ACD5Y6I3_AVESA